MTIILNGHNLVCTASNIYEYVRPLGRLALLVSTGADHMPSLPRDTIVDPSGSDR